MSSAYANEIVRLADDLLLGLRFPAVSSEAVLHKAMHLARVTNQAEYAEYFRREAEGYPDSYDGPRLLRMSGRMVSDRLFIQPSILHLERVLPAQRQSAEQARQRFLSASGANVDRHLGTFQTSEASKTQTERVIDTFRRETHSFAAMTRFQALFGDASGNIFDLYRRSVDGLLADEAADAISKFPAVFERLAAGDTEAIGHAMLSCRRIVEAFAERICPAQAEQIEVEGEKIDIRSGNTKNQLRAAIRAATTSDSRRARLTRGANALWERVSTGVHADIAPDEARALVLNTYLLLGEIAEMRASVRN
ncbi:hypothetical protein [Aureimonas leprariae]|uniref:AbiTii domain-containing protein n=1 Tax=Plantimonas leprariae TaxID=2615207 RepID=A0A7V7PL74_9HYPH|nr:hypothetical protein [Aureimonas leprariae]KAB0676721.1 hypothetical protein F6X38_20690 [Aureimonas leprariae]